jgi:hypothetical protein
MQQVFGCKQFNKIQSQVKAFLAHAVVVTAVAFACGSGYAQADSSALGSYAGTITVSGTETDPDVSYRARVKVSLPVSDRNDTSISAEFLAGEAPNASVLISEWETFTKDKVADSGGMLNTTKCSLAAPTEIPMTATGVLNVDLKEKKHSLSLTLLSTKDLAFNCTQSRSGAFKEKHGVSLYIGTGAPGMQDETQLPFTDATHLAANYTLHPPADAVGKGPIIQQWDLHLVH